MSLAELLDDARRPNGCFLRDLLANRDEATLQRARIALGRSCVGDRRRRSRPWPRFADRPYRPSGGGQVDAWPDAGRRSRFSVPRAQPRDREACRLQHGQILGLYGQNAYRRYERRALEEAIEILSRGGHRHRRRHGDGSPAASICCSRRCTTVWLTAGSGRPHGTVTAQGDLRPMAASREAMAIPRPSLPAKRLSLQRRHARGHQRQPLLETFQILRAEARDAMDGHRMTRIALPRPRHCKSRRCRPCRRLREPGAPTESTIRPSPRITSTGSPLRRDRHHAALDVDEDAGLSPGYKLKLNSTTSASTSSSTTPSTASASSAPRSDRRHRQGAGSVSRRRGHLHARRVEPRMEGQFLRVHQ